MSRVVVRQAVIGDVYALASCLRDGDRAEVLSVNRSPRRVLRASFRSSLAPPRVALVDGEIAAMWGLGGDILSETGEPWLLTGHAAVRTPFSFLRIARRELAAMLVVKKRLENYVAADYAKAVRLLEVLGFQLGEPEPIGPKRALFRRFWIEA